jgi:four helix bundle protein
MKNEFTIYIKFFDYLKYLHLLVHDFPKEYKYFLGKNIIDTGFTTMDNMVEANMATNNQKFEKILLASVSFDRLKTRLKMAYELKLITQKKYSYLIKENKEIGTELTSWLKWAKKTGIEPK